MVVAAVLLLAEWFAKTCCMLAYCAAVWPIEFESDHPLTTDLDFGQNLNSRSGIGFLSSEIKNMKCWMRGIWKLGIFQA
jgi:hypothetical protein